MSTTTLSSLHILIEGLQDGVSLDVSKIGSSWKNAFGGTIERIKSDHRSYSFSSKCTEDKVALLREYNKPGQLDELLALGDEFRVLEVTEDEECLYQYVPSIPLPPRAPTKDVNSNKMKKVAKSIDVIVMTVTDIEREAFLSFLEPLRNQQAVLEGPIGDTTYRLGQFGRYNIAHVECTMGSDGRQGAMLTTINAVNELKPKALILLGIAFGVDRKRQRLGDVIIAESIRGYELQRVGDQRTIPRGEEVQSGTILSERFRTRRDDWKLTLGPHRNVKVYQGLMLSGEKLIDKKELRDELVSKYPTAQGGEMEGAGAYAAAARKGVEIILVKAICDWADGHKNDHAQAFAAYAAVDLAAHVLSKPDVLGELGAFDVGLPATADDPSPSRSPPRISLNKTDVLELLSLASEHALGGSIDTYVNEKSFFIGLTNYLLSIVERMKQVAAPIPSKPIIDLTDRLSPDDDFDEHETVASTEGKGLEPIRFEEAIFSVTARHLMACLASLSQNKHIWSDLRANDVETRDAIAELQEIKTRFQQISGIIEKGPQSLQSYRFEREWLLKSADNLLAHFRHLPKHAVAPHEIIEEMENEYDELDRCTHICVEWFNRLAKSSLEAHSQ